jgi:hypothetical protein
MRRGAQAPLPSYKTKIKKEKEKKKMNENRKMHMAWHEAELHVIDTYVSMKHRPSRRNAQRAVAAVVKAAQARARVDFAALAAEEAAELAACC